MSLTVFNKDGSVYGKTVPLGTVPLGQSASDAAGPTETLPPGWVSLGCDSKKPPVCRARDRAGTIWYKTGKSGWVPGYLFRTLENERAEAEAKRVASLPSPGRAQSIQPPSAGNKLGEPAPSLDDLLQEAVDTLGKSGPRKAPTDMVASDEQSAWRWDGQKNVYTTDWEEEARQRRMALGDIGKRRQASGQRRPNPYRNRKPY